VPFDRTFGRSLMTASGATLVGRTALVSELERGLGRRAVALVHGLAGIGKSTVLWELLERMRARGRPTAYVELRAREPLEGALGRLGVDLGAGEHGGPSALLGAVEERGAVVAIDSAERLAPRSLVELVRRAVGSLRRGRLLLATRRLPPLVPADALDVFAIEVPMLTRKDAMALLTGYGLCVDEAFEAPGHPLLLKMMVALGRHPGPAEERRRHLEPFVSALIRDVMRNLARATRGALALLCANPYPWKADLVAELVDPREIDRLERAGVATRRGDAVHVHPLFATAAGRDRKPATPPRARLRRAAHLLAARAHRDPTAALAAAELWRLGGDPRSAVRLLHEVSSSAWIEGLAHDYLAVLGRLRLGGPSGDLARLLEARVELRRSVTAPTLRALAPLARSRSPEVARAASTELGRAAYNAGDMTTALGYLRRAVGRSEPSDPTSYPARVTLVYALDAAGDHAGAVAMLEGILAAEDNERLRSQAELLAAERLVEHEGRPREALGRLRRTPAASQHLRANRSIVAGRALRDLGRYRWALRFLDAAFAFYRAEVPHVAVTVICDRAETLVAHGRARAALELCSRADATEARASPAHATWLRLCRAAAHTELGELDAAREALGRVGPAARWTDYSLRRTLCAAELTREMALDGETAKLIERAETTYTQDVARAKIAWLRGRWLLDAGRAHEALPLLEDALGAFGAARMRPWMVRVLCERARAELALGRRDDASLSAALALSRARHLESPPLRVQALMRFAECEWRAGKLEAADAACVEAREAALGSGATLAVAEILALRATVALAARRPAQAAQLVRQARSLLAGRGARRLETLLGRLGAVARLGTGDLAGARSALETLPREDAWRARLGVAVALRSGGELRPALAELGRRLTVLPALAAHALLEEATALGVPAAGTARLVTPDGERPVSLEEATWRALAHDGALLLDVVGGSCRYVGRACPGIARSPILSRTLSVLLERRQRPLSTTQLFELVWGPPERHTGYENLVRVTIARLRRLLGGRAGPIVSLGEGYAIGADCAFLLVTT
jgi:tetratricopeptide (TPR) repeat protein